MTDIESKPTETSESSSDKLMERFGTHPLHGVFPRETRIGKAVSWYAAGAFAYDVGRRAKNAYTQHKESKDKYVIGISSNEEEELYTLVIKWLSDNTDIGKLETFDLITTYKKPKYRVTRAASQDEQFDTVIAGVPVKVNLNEHKVTNMGSFSVRRDLSIKCRSQDECDTVIDFIRDLYDKDQYGDEDMAVSEIKPLIQYFTYTKTGWVDKTFDARNRESVVLSGTSSDDLFNDIDFFISMKKEYARIDIPWHRGYLFHGPPGTGKTSLGMAVASAFEMPVCFIPLKALKSDEDLSRAFNTAPGHRGFVLILEDIDVVKGVQSRENNVNDTGEGVSLQGMLNLLDGADTPSGLITIMTTNYADRLDSALIRPGRVDFRLEVGYLKDDQVRGMLKWYFKRDVDDLPPIKGDIAPAAITGIVKDHILEPDVAIEKIRNLIEETHV